MTNITIDICGAQAKRLAQDGILTTGMVGATVTFQFDEQWSGLRKTAVFRGGGVTRDVLDIGSVVTIPSEVLQSQGTLSVGVEGYNADGTIVIPTVWESNSYIHQGANASGDTSTDPELPVWAQIRAQIGDLDELDTTAKETLVAAINEALTKGGGSVDPAEVERLVNKHLATNPPAAGKDGKSAYEIALEEGFDGSEAEWLESLQGTPGKDGADGKSAYQYAQDGGYTGTEEEFAAKLATESSIGMKEIKLLRSFALAEGESVNSLLINTCDDGTTLESKGYRKVGVLLHTKGTDDMTTYVPLVVVVNNLHTSGGYSSAQKALYKNTVASYFTIEAEGCEISVKYGHIGSISSYYGESSYWNTGSLIYPRNECSATISAINIYNNNYTMEYGTKVEVWGIY